MKIPLAAAVFAVQLILVGSLQGVAAGAEPAQPKQTVQVPAPPQYAILESYVGGTWVGELPPQKSGGHAQFELHFSWVESRQGVRFESYYVEGERRVPYTSGMYVWNPAKKRLTTVYTDANGALTEGVISQDSATVLVQDLVIANRDGSVDSARVRRTKESADAFNEEIFVYKDKAWAKVAEVKYGRRK